MDSGCAGTIRSVETRLPVSDYREDLWRSHRNSTGLVSTQKIIRSYICLLYVYIVLCEAVCWCEDYTFEVFCVYHFIYSSFKYFVSVIDTSRSLYKWGVMCMCMGLGSPISINNFVSVK